MQELSGLEVQPHKTTVDANVTANESRIHQVPEFAVSFISIIIQVPCQAFSSDG